MNTCWFGAFSEDFLSVTGEWLRVDFGVRGGTRRLTWTEASHLLTPTARLRTCGVVWTLCISWAIASLLISSTWCAWIAGLITASSRLCSKVVDVWCWYSSLLRVLSCNTVAAVLFMVKASSALCCSTDIACFWSFADCISSSILSLIYVVVHNLQVYLIWNFAKMHSWYEGSSVHVQWIFLEQATHSSDCSLRVSLHTELGEWSPDSSSWISNFFCSSSSLWSLS